MTGAFAMPAIFAGILLISLKAVVVAAVGRMELDVEENPPSQPQTAAMELDVDGAAFSSAKSDDAWSIAGLIDLDSLWAFARPMLTHYLNDDVDNARFNSLSSAFRLEQCLQAASNPVQQCLEVNRCRACLGA